MIDRLLEATEKRNWSLASRLLSEQWINGAVDCFSVKEKDPWDSQFDEKKINELFYPFTAALCQNKDCRDEEGNPSVQRLAKENGYFSSTGLSTRGQICGRMFRYGEPTYCCRECATDATCVLCHDCFMNSEHKNHKYKMHTSQGSGVCDCSDVEAFSEYPVCSLHAPNEEQKEMMDKTISKDLQNRLHNLALIALKFITEFLCFEDEDSDEVLAYFQDSRTLSNAKYQTILFNDETHTYDVVIRALVVSIDDCDESQAMKLASTVDREGRTVVCYGTRERCDSVRENVQRRTQRETNRRTQRSGPLLVKVIRSPIISCQHFAVHMIHWLSAQVKLFPPLATCVGNAMLYDCSAFCRLKADEDEDVLIPTVDYDTTCIYPTCKHDSPCLRMVLADRQLWKSARLSYHQLLMSTILMHFDQKRTFGRLMIENYETIYNSFTDDDHDHKFSIISMTVQVFTVPTISRFLIREYNAINKIAHYQHQFMEKYLRQSPSRNMHVLDFTGNEFPAVLERSLHSITDLGYLLSITPKRHDWDAGLRKNYLIGATEFLRFLRDFQHMDEVKRQYTDHQLTESEWETAFHIFMRIVESIFMINQWALTDQMVHMNLLTKCCLEIVYQTEHMKEFEKRRNVTVNGFTASCIEYDISSAPVSIHQPLWRFTAALFTASPEFLENYVCVEEDSNECPVSITANTSDCPWEPVKTIGKKNLRGFRSLLMEMPLRCIVLRAQAAAQLWRRNGFSLDHQLHYYSNVCRDEMFDRDILMLQVVAAQSDPNRFLIRILDRFSLIRWANFGFEDLPSTRYTESTPSTPSATQEDLSRITVTLAEEMLHLIIILLMERYVPGVGQITTADALKREVLHILCTGAKPFSQLERYILRGTYYRKELLQDAVTAVGDFRRPPNSTTMGVFQLKPEIRSHYNPFFWHYQKVQVSAAEQCQKKDRANESRDIKACAPPIPPRFEPFFAPVVHLAESQLLTQIISMTFDRHLKSSRFSSEGLLHRALFLCGIALNEQLRVEDERDEALANQRQAPERFRFMEHAEELKLLDKLQKLESKADVDVFGDLIWWTTQRYKEAQSRYYHGIAPSKEKSQEKSASENVSKAEKAEIAKRKRQQAMERMKRLQQSFKTQHQEFMDDEPKAQTSTANQPADESSMEIDGSAKQSTSSQSVPLEVNDEPEVGILSDDTGFPVCLGANKSVARLRAMRSVTCALCQEDEVLTYETAPGIVCAAYVECNRLFAQQQLPPHETNQSLQTDDYRYHAPADLHWGTNVSSCSHTMHYSCYRTYVDGLLQRDRNRQRQAMAQRTLNYERHEYLCPLCRTLCNSAMPLLPVVSLLQGVETFSSGRKNVDEEFSDWVNRMHELCLVPLYSTTSGENPTIKSHARKRSHSERSLAEYVKENTKEPAPLAISTTQRVGSPFPSPFPSFLNLSLSGSLTSSPSHQANSPQSSNESTPFRGTETITNFLQETLNKLKSFLPKQHKLYAPHNFTAWDTVLPFFATLRQCRMDMLNSDEIVEMLGVYSACGYILRCICAVLKTENKPLFGAFNTRQQDCINGMVRLCSVAAFTAKPMALRLLASRFLTPFVVPLTANRPVPSQIYPARTLHNSNEIRRIARNFQLRRNVIDPNVSSMSDLTTSPSSSSTAPASPGPSSQRQTTPQLTPTPQATKPNNPFFEMNILNVDMISMAIQLAMLTGWTWVKQKQFFHNLARVDEGAPKIPDGSVDEHHCVQLALMAHLFQAFACHKPKENLNDDDINRLHLNESMESSSSKTTETNVELDNRLRSLYSLACGSESTPDLQQLKTSVHGCALEFMRSLAVFYNALTMVPPPEALKDPSLDEFEPLCRYLALPIGLKAMLDGDCVERLFSMWSSYVRLPGAQISVARPMKPRMLIDLPDDYCELINRAAKFRCPAVRTNELNGPITTMCLLCGEMLCSQSYCCQKTFNHENVGSCSYHMFHCGGNSGMFLRIRDCNIMFLTASKRGCQKPAPYVDEFGETDPGFRRGNPLYLNKELYKKYQRLWLHQEVTEEVLNQYEVNYRNLAFEWGVF